MLDSNAVSDLLKNPEGRVAATLSSINTQGAKVALSVIVSGELRYGLAKRPSERLRAHLHELLSTLPILSLEDDADQAYANLRNHLERTGSLIGPNDMWIAAHAIALDAVLVTDNVREFSRVPGLKIENWLRSSE